MDIPIVLDDADGRLLAFDNGAYGAPVVIDNSDGKIRVFNTATGYRPGDNYSTEDLRRFRGGMLETASAEDVIGKDYAPVRKYLR